MVNLKRIPIQRRQYHMVHAPIGGLRLDLGSPVIPERASPNCNNVTFENGNVRKSWGEETFGRTEALPFQDEESAGVRQPATIMEFKVFKKGSTVPVLMVFTTAGVYYYKMSLNHFLTVTQGAIIEDCEDTWTGVAGTSIGTYLLPWRGSAAILPGITGAFSGPGIVAFENFSPTDYSAFTYIHFRCSIHQSSAITSLSKGDLVLDVDDTDGIASPVESFDIPAMTKGSNDEWIEVYLPIADPDSWAAIRSVGLRSTVAGAGLSGLFFLIDDIRAVKGFTGDQDDNFSSAVLLDVNDVDFLAWTNGSDPPQKWDQSTEFAEDLLPTGDPASYRPKWMLSYGDRLCLYNDVGQEFPRRIYWSVAFNPEAFTGTGSGVGDLEGVMADGDSIQRAERLGDVAVIYGEHSIAIQQYRANNVENPFIFSARVNTVGLAAPRALINLRGHEHVFLGWEDVYSFRGGRNVDRIGRAIRDELFRDINPRAIHKSFMVQHEAERLVRLYVPVLGSEIPNRYYELDLIERVWSRGERDYTAGTAYEFVNSTTWKDLSDNFAIEADPWRWSGLTTKGTRWSDFTLETNQDVPIYGDANGVVFRSAQNTFKIGNDSYTGVWETKDFVTKGEYRRGAMDWMELDFEVAGEGFNLGVTPVLNVSYSVDFGINFTPLGSPISLVAEYIEYRLDFEINSSQIRFRFSCATEGFALRQFEIGFIPASDRAVLGAG